MFALAAVLTFFLALLGIRFGSVDMTLLGLMFLAAHLLFGSPVWWPLTKDPKRG